MFFNIKMEYKVIVSKRLWDCWNNSIQMKGKKIENLKNRFLYI